jgi:nucleoside-diphosphate-sugar epimerase
MPAFYKIFSMILTIAALVTLTVLFSTQMPSLAINKLTVSKPIKLVTESCDTFNNQGQRASQVKTRRLAPEGFAVKSRVRSHPDFATHSFDLQRMKNNRLPESQDRRRPTSLLVDRNAANTKYHVHISPAKNRNTEKQSPQSLADEDKLDTLTSDETCVHKITSDSVVLVTGAAGFIGSALVSHLRELGVRTVVGIDTVNDYYSPRLKQLRIDTLVSGKGATFFKGDVCDEDMLAWLFDRFKFTHVVHLAAQAGVRYSLVKPMVYVKENVQCFVALLERLRQLAPRREADQLARAPNLHDPHAASDRQKNSSRVNARDFGRCAKSVRATNNIADGPQTVAAADAKAWSQGSPSGAVTQNPTKHYSEIPHFIYASSSSVYGLNTHIPFSELDSVDRPANLYGVTKRTDELLAEAYFHLFGIHSIGLRFFTVYGPWGRPDMAIMQFADKITRGEPIEVFNSAEMMR